MGNRQINQKTISSNKKVHVDYISYPQKRIIITNKMDAIFLINSVYLLGTTHIYSDYTRLYPHC